MSSRATNIMAFVMGGAIGALITWRYIKAKYETLAQEEIDSVKEVFAKRAKDSKNTEMSMSEDDAREKDIYADILKSQGYRNDVGGEDNVNLTKPYVIPPEQFGEEDDYDRISLTYYADQILADESGDIVEDVEETIGFDSLSHFGEYEDDSVFVRNDCRKCDYEILLDHRTYSSICY